MNDFWFDMAKIFVLSVVIGAGFYFGVRFAITLDKLTQLIINKLF